MSTAGLTWKLKHKRQNTRCQASCLCKRHLTRSTGQFQPGHLAGPGWIAKQGRGWTTEERLQSPRMTGKRHTTEARVRISEGLRQHNGNTTGENASNDYPPEYQTARLLVFKRDDYRCRICRNHGVLHAHHLNYDKTNNRLENLVALCSTCHLRHHRRQWWPVSLMA